jgi:obg-like ATPase 1
VLHTVFRAFEDAEITHVDDKVDPIRDMETISEELRLKFSLDFVDLQDQLYNT